MVWKRMKILGTMGDMAGVSVTTSFAEVTCENIDRVKNRIRTTMSMPAAMSESAEKFPASWI